MTNSPHDSATPTFEDVRRTAKRLLRDLRAGDGEALARLASIHPKYRVGSPTETIKLHHAQLVIARESGFASWPRLKHWFAWREGRAQPLQTFRTDIDYFRDRAAGFLEMLQAGDDRAIEQVRLHHPKYRDLCEPEHREEWGPFAAEDAELVVARQHGHESWEMFAGTLRDLEQQREEDASAFRRAYEAIEAADLEALKRAVAADPDCIGQAGTNGNSLLNLAAGALVTPDLSRPPSEANSEPDRRMKLVEMLLAAGAEPDRANHKGWTALHQAAYSNNVALADRLLAAGATIDLEAYDDGGTPLVVALWWGHCEVADLLARIAVAPDNLRVAAGLGRIDALAGFFDKTGRPMEAAGRARGFHRPHSGFPAWKPTPGHVQEVLDDAFSFAVRSGQVEAMAFLRERGADVNGIACNGSPLEWAVIRNRTEAVTWLIAHGADVNRKADFARNVGQTALHSAAFADNPELARILVEAGADPSIRDEAYDSTPLGWALHLDRPNAAAFFVEACWDRCDLDDLIMAGASAETVGKRLDADPEQLAGWTGTGTPLRAAAVSGRVDLVRLLLERGASPDGRSRDGATARDLAQKGDHSDVIDLIDAFIRQVDS